MASVVKDSRDRSPYWIACYTDSTGRRLKKSTKLTNKKDALEVALALEHGEALARKGAFTEIRLREILEQTLERVIGGPVQHHSVKTWFDDWCEEKSKSRTPATAERYSQVAREFIESLSSRANLPLEHITPKDIRGYRDAELKKGVSNRTANMSVKIVSMAFNAALRQGKIKFNPCIGLDALPEESAEREPFTLDEIRKLVKAAKGDWKGAILFAFYTGARLGDVANMEAGAIDFERGLITFTPQKTKRTKKKAVRIPIHPGLAERISRISGLLFPTLAGRGTGGRHGLSAEFATIMRKAGIRGDVIRHTDNGRRNMTKSFHSLRHSFNSALANAGIAREMRQVLTGHASERMNEIYTHRELEPLRTAIAALPNVGAK